jgi:hypothetical protein
MRRRNGAPTARKKVVIPAQAGIQRLPVVKARASAEALSSPA